jgi:TonB family protein
MISLDSVTNPQEQSSQGKGWIVSLVTHIIVIALLFVTMTITKLPPPEQEGLLVNLGLQDEGQGQETPKGETEEVTPDPAENQEQDPIQPTSSRAPVKQVAQKTITSNEASDVNVKAADAKKKANADAKQKADEEAQRQKAYNTTKKSYGDLLGSGGKGNTGKPGSQGDPNGDPNSNVLEGISNGSGRVGGGLGKRGVLHEPKIDDKSQKTGRVVISVCVDKNGKVIKAEYTQKGSTTTDSELKEIAKKAAMQFKFTLSEIEEQCGTITVDFKIR